VEFRIFLEGRRLTISLCHINVITSKYQSSLPKLYEFQEYYRLLFGGKVLLFRRNVLPPSSRSKSKSNKEQSRACVLYLRHATGQIV
jgi:hypothetical protein